MCKKLGFPLGSIVFCVFYSPIFALALANFFLKCILSNKMIIKTIVDFI